MIYDPLANDLFFVTSLPDEPPEGAAFTRGDGVYWAYPGGEWVKLPLKFSDAAVEDMLSMGGGVITAACLLIDRLTARIQPGDYITSGNAGGQSLSFPSLADMLAFYRGLKKDLLDEEARLNAGSFIITPRPPVGGVYEGRDPWG
jgi:hypothetical protein